MTIHPVERTDPQPVGEPETGAAAAPERGADPATTALLVLQVVEQVVAHRAAAWPAGVVSGVGALMGVAALAAEVFLDDPLTTTELVAVMASATTLMLVGPLVVARRELDVSDRLSDTLRAIDVHEAHRDREARSPSALLDEPPTRRARRTSRWFR